MAIQRASIKRSTRDINVHLGHCRKKPPKKPRKTFLQSSENLSASRKTQHLHWVDLCHFTFPTTKKKHTLWGKQFFGEPLPTWQAHGFMQLPLSFRGFIYCGAGVSTVVS